MLFGGRVHQQVFLTGLGWLLGWLEGWLEHLHPIKEGAKSHPPLMAHMPRERPGQARELLKRTANLASRSPRTAAGLERGAGGGGTAWGDVPSPFVFWFAFGFGLLLRRFLWNILATKEEFERDIYTQRFPAMAAVTRGDIDGDRNHNPKSNTNSI